MSRASRSALRRLRAEQQLRELAHPVGGEPAADPLGRDEPHRRRLLAHLPQRLVVRLEVELRDEAQPADEPQRILGEAVRRHGAQHAASRGRPAPPNGSTSSPSPRRRAIAFTVKSRRAQVVLDRRRRRRRRSRSRAARARSTALAARRRELDPGRREPADRAVARVEPQADGPAGDDEVLDAAVRLEQPRAAPRSRRRARGSRRPSTRARAARRARRRRRGTRRARASGRSPRRLALVESTARGSRERDRLDLDERARRELRDLDGRARGRRVADVAARRPRSSPRSRRGSAGTPSSSRAGRATCPPPRGSRAGSRTPARSAPRSPPETISVSPGRERELPRDEHEAVRP